MPVIIDECAQLHLSPVPKPMPDVIRKRGLKLACLRSMMARPTHAEDNVTHYLSERNTYMHFLDCSLMVCWLVDRCFRRRVIAPVAPFTLVKVLVWNQ